MSATVYSVPEGFQEPDFGNYETDSGGFDTQAYFDACDKHEKDVAAWCRDNSTADLAGEIIRFPVADGKATYMVYTLKPLALIHLNYGDGYQIDDMTLRGMRVQDVRELVRRQKALNEIFGSKRSPSS